jgi:hypothetical protein
MGRLALIVLVAAGVAWYFVAHARAGANERELASIASVIAGRPVHVHCQSFGGELVDVSSEPGKVEFDQYGKPGDAAKFKRKVCKSLERLARDTRGPEFACVSGDLRCPGRVHDDAWAALVFAHESVHLQGELDEAFTQCKGVQNVAFVAKQLGASPTRARQIARYAWEYVYPEADEEYRTDACFNGGPLDIRPGNPRWP